MSATLLSPFVDLVGAANVLSGDAARPFATDVYRAKLPPLGVVRPTSVEQLQAVVRTATGRGIAVAVRGGGASYTDGYTPSVERQLLIDMGGLNRIVTIDEVNGYVTVEAGVTWATLRDTLGARGLRTPFWGPFSGLAATIGGSMSQNSISHGSGAYGISADSALSFDVVTADGSLLATGAAAVGTLPFTRHFGPDLTGLFTGDCGALGIKARVTLPLLRARPAHRPISFAFPTLAAMHGAMQRIALERIEDTHFALDAALSQGQIARQERAGAAVDMALAIVRSSPWLGAGIKQVVKAGLFARRDVAASAYMTHYIVEGFDDAEVRARLHRIRQLVGDTGREIAPTVPAVVRGMPFAPLFNTLGPSGERWVPLHGVLPNANVAAFETAYKAYLAQHAAEMEALGVWTGGMYATVGAGGFLYEVAIYWPDEITDYHRAAIPADYLGQLPRYPASVAARDYVDRLKREIADLMDAHGAVHFQIGKAYHYADRLAAAPRALVAALKQALDPDGLMSPGNLGF